MQLGGGVNICFSHLSVKPFLTKSFLNYYILFIFTSNGRLFLCVCVFVGYLSVVMTVDHNFFHCPFLCYRKLEFVGEQSKRESIPVDKIESVQIVASEIDQQGQWVRGHGATHRGYGVNHCMLRPVRESLVENR